MKNLTTEDTEDTEWTMTEDRGQMTDVLVCREWSSDLPVTQTVYCRETEGGPGKKLSSTLGTAADIVYV